VETIVLNVTFDRVWSYGRDPFVGALALAVVGAAAVALILKGPTQDVTRAQWLLLLVPCLIALMPVVWRVRLVQVSSTALMAVIVVLTALSVGVCFIPALVLMIMATRAFRA